MNKPIERHYVVGLPVCVSVDNLGRVTFDVDLAEVEDVYDNIEVEAPWTTDDVKALSEAASRIGNRLTVTIQPHHPHRPGGTMTNDPAASTANIVGGKQYRVTNRLFGHKFPIGAIVTAQADGSDQFKGTDLDGVEGATWFLGEGEVEPVEEDVEPTPTPRPTIDFSTSSRATARHYAADLVSRVNKPETNEVLRAVADGRTDVDAYALAEALLDAMRHVSTRFGQSLARRRAGEKAAHLGHIAHAVLANHADGLPAYEPGERSRLVEEVRTALTEAREEVEAMTEEIDKIKAERDALAAKLSVAEAERDAFASTVDYAIEGQQDGFVQRVLGYLDGVSA